MESGMLNTQQKKLVIAISSIMLLASTGTLLHAEVVLPTIKLKASEQDQNGYTVKKSSAATKLDLSLKETPQSVSVITAEQIQDQQLKTLGEVLDQTPGIYQQRYGATGAVGTGGEYASYYARGSKINNFLIDGVVSAPVTSGRTGMSLSTLDPAIYENITVVKGATGLSSGIGNPSASINLRRKLADSNVAKGNVNISTSAFDDKWAGYRTTVDVQSPLNDSGTIRGRTVLSYNNYDSFMNWGDSQSALFYSTLGADLGENTTLNVGALFQRAKSNGLTVHGFTNYSNGVASTRTREDNAAARWAYSDVDTLNAFVELEHRFNNGWKIQGNYNYLTQDTDAVYAVVGSAAASSTSPGTANYLNNTGSVTAGYQELKPEMHGVDLSAVGPYQLFGREHQLMVGASYQNVQSDDPNYGRKSGTQWVNLDTWNGNIEVPAGLYTSNGTRNKTDISQYGYYMATRFNPLDKLNIIVGARGLGYEFKDISADKLTADYSKNAVTPYAGITYDINPFVTAYASYTNIYMPQSSRDINYKVLDPLEGISYEGGLKSSFYDDKLNLTAAYFESKLDNVALKAGTFTSGDHKDEAYYTGISGAKTRGFELEASGEILPDWNLHAGYTQVKTKAQGNRTGLDMPEQQFKLYTTYQLPVLEQRLKVGGGIRWQSEIVDSSLTGAAYDANKQGSFTVVDLMAKYQATKDISLGLNVNNLTDEEYRVNVSNNTYGDPRTYIASMTYSF